MSRALLIAGIGNIFFGDDGFGVEVARKLAQSHVPEGVEVIDFGTRGYDLAFALTDGWPSAILVDAVARGGQPGTLYSIDPEITADRVSNADADFDAHSMHPLAVLQLVQSLGGTSTKITILGCEPAQISADSGVGLTPAVQHAVDQAVELLQRHIVATLKVPSPAANRVAAGHLAVG